ncbi:Gfo/Idh/MocA family protein [Mitsuokella multacida]|uniref:Gfo/Idh/MocA family protein n=1 Tax=Mitsuokella multacida TaxID=52226 RepID=UPI002596C237|nr:Gfo/Idh/MocA family oxidoreductase [Mitsuokella multacida]
MKEVRIGLIGAGWMGHAHTRAYHNAKMVFGDDLPILRMISDVNEAQGRKAAQDMGYEEFVSDWHKVIESPDVDLVDVATPNCMHYEMVKEALKHKKHVFCEKPLSLTATESEELAKLAQENGVVNYCGFSNVMNPANQYVKELVQSGALGRIMRVHATYDQDMLLDPKIPLAWRHIRKLAGSGALGDLCSHLLSVFQIILGDIDEVMGMDATVIPERPLKPGSKEMGKVENDDIITFMAHFANGAIGDISSSRVATGRKNYFYYEIQGTEGSVVYDLERMGEVKVYFKSDADKLQGRDAGFRTVLLNPQHWGYRYFQPAGGIAIAFDDMKTLQAHVLMQALQGEKYDCDFALGAKVDRIIAAVLKSVESRQWEKC